MVLSFKLGDAMKGITFLYGPQTRSFEHLGANFSLNPNVATQAAKFCRERGQARRDSKSASSPADMKEPWHALT